MKTIQLITISFLVFALGCGKAKKDALSSKKEELEKVKSEIAELTMKADKLKGEIAILDTNQAVYMVDVHLDTVQVGSFSNKVELQGIIESKKTVNLTTEMGGIISRVNVKQGSRVSAGQVLISIDNSTVTSQISELRNALSLAQTTHEKQANLFKQNIGTEMQVLQAKNRVDDLKQKIQTTQAMASKYQLRAPYSGVIDDVMVSKGEMAVPGLPLVTLVNKSDNVIKIQASEKFVGSFKKGDKVKVRYPVLGLEAIERIQTVGQNIDPGNRSFNLFIKPTQLATKVKPNMLAIVEVSEFEMASVITVPTKLVYRLEDKRYVYVAEKNSDGEMVARRREITIQKSFQNKTVIQSGLKASDMIIVDGFQNVADGDLLNII